MHHPLCKGKVMDLPSRSAAVRLRQLAQSEGAVPIATFMAIANAHYYATRNPFGGEGDFITAPETRSEEHTSELQSLMRISYAVFCLKKKTNSTKILHN